MNRKLITITAFAIVATHSLGQTYLNPEAPLEERVKDALSRMTTHEKINILHAQSKFTSAGVPRLGIRQLNMDDGPHGVREQRNGTHGMWPDGPTTPLWHSHPSHAWHPHGTETSRIYTANR